MSDSDKPHLWELVGSELHARCKILDVYRKRFRHPARQIESDFFIIEAADWVNIVAITPEREVVAVHQYRYGIEGLTLEVPAGMMEPGEDPVEGGVRELLEETGFAGERAENLGWVYPNPAIQNNRCFIIAVHDARQVSTPAWDEHEEILTELIPLLEIPERLGRGDFTHALAVCALQRYLSHYPL
jgi:ADP-ribose pyrophosphatase